MHQLRVRTSWVNKRRHLKEVLGGIWAHKQPPCPPPRPGNLWSACFVTLGSGLLFYLKFLRFSQFCSQVCTELPQSASPSTHLSPNPNSDSLMRHCSTSISLYGPGISEPALYSTGKRFLSVWICNHLTCHAATPKQMVACLPLQYIEDFLVQFSLSL